MKTIIPFLISVGCAFGQYTSPPAQTSVTVGGKKITITYHAPSMHGRKIFGPASTTTPPLEAYGRIWRAGANEATALHTDADLQIKNLTVPKGDYTLFIWLDPAQWQLVVNKQTNQWGLEYHKEQDLGRVPMDMSKPSAPIETFKITLSSTQHQMVTTNKLQMEWENTIASVPIVVK
jgi:hypothetical protein